MSNWQCRTSSYQQSLRSTKIHRTQNKNFKKFIYSYFILVGCILLRNVYIALLNIHLQSQLRVLLTYASLFHSQLVSVPFGPSSSESQYIIFSHTSPENYRYLNGSVVSKYNITYCDSPEDGPKGPKHVVLYLVLYCISIVLVLYLYYI
jgi:hypothetical protein